jgi:hypothetical protein
VEFAAGVTMSALDPFYLVKEEVLGRLHELLAVL